MSLGIASLHKILKDETRRKIILLLHDKESISYVDLMKDLQIVSTGKMNYHLKVLNGLLSKNMEGQYTLTDKGTLAARLLLEFPEENNHMQRERELRNIIFGLANAIVLSNFLGFVSLTNARAWNINLQAIIWSIFIFSVILINTWIYIVYFRKKKTSK